MKTMKTAEASEWIKAFNLDVDQHGTARGAGDNSQRRRFEVPKYASKHAWFCQFIESSLRPWSRCLFWVTEWNIWESSENWHLYYRLRQSYGDKRLIEEAPVHLFLNYENHDLISFLQIGLSMGWDFSVLTQENYAHVFVSHDEWIEFGMRDGAELTKIDAELTKSGLKVFPARTSHKSPITS